MSKITLNKSHFFYNLDEIIKKTKSKEKIALVLKDNAYGHGLLEIAKLASEYGIKKAVVRSNYEAEVVEDFFDYILVLADIPKSANKKIRYTINDADSISKFPKGSLVELKVNTSMNRNGINIEDITASIRLIKEQGLELEAIFTHHSCADEMNDNYARQKENFEKIKRSFEGEYRFHSCNSAALFREEDFSEDMARVGISAYGCLELPKELAEVTQKPVLSLYTQKISSRTLKKGDSVGYGATYVASKEERVSNYDIGYGDGFLRSNSNVFQTKDGVKIAGRISMDNSSFLSEKEELLLFSDAKDVAKYAKTISYEVLTSLKSYIKREIV